VKLSGCYLSKSTWVAVKQEAKTLKPGIGYGTVFKMIVILYK
jgi:hypothetical protein